jgi:hypothetical protein
LVSLWVDESDCELRGFVPKPTLLFCLTTCAACLDNLRRELACLQLTPIEAIYNGHVRFSLDVRKSDDR